VPFKIIWPEPVLNQLRKLDRSIVKRIFEAVTRLEENPDRWVKRIVNSPYYSFRVGDYRIIVDIQMQELIVLVIKVGHRKNVYG
jgi:mRNA interferase RelE/StbE